MDPSELLAAWNANNDRPMWIRENRELIHEHTDTSEPIPDASAYQVREWVDRYGSVVTRQLKEAAGEYSEEQADE